MFVHEVEYKVKDKNDRQERYIEIDSWNDYVRCVLDYSLAKPSIRTPDNFKATKISEYGELTGHFFINSPKGSEEVIHIARTVKEEEVPKDEEVWKVEIIEDY